MENNQRQSSLDWLKNARLGNVKQLRSLMESHPHLDVNRVDEQSGNSALHMAVESGNIEALEYVLRYVDPLLQNHSEENALHRALYFEHFDLVEVLLEHPKAALMSVKRNCIGQSVLDYAAANDACGDITKKLLRYCNPADKDPEGRTAAHYAARWNNVAVLKVLIEYQGANVLNTVDVYGGTCLHMAAQKGSWKTLKELLHWCDPNGQDHKGNTPLHLALEQGNLGCVEALLIVSDLHQRNNAGHRAVDVAMRAENKAITQRVQEAMALQECVRLMEAVDEKKSSMKPIAVGVRKVRL